MHLVYNFLIFLLRFQISTAQWLNCRNLKDEQNCSHIGGGDTYLLRSWSHFSTIQYPNSNVKLPPLVESDITLVEGAQNHIRLSSITTKINYIMSCRIYNTLLGYTYTVINGHLRPFYASLATKVAVCEPLFRASKELTWLECKVELDVYQPPVPLSSALLSSPCPCPHRLHPPPFR